MIGSHMQDSHKYTQIIAEIQNKHSGMFYHHANMLSGLYEKYQDNISFLIKNKFLYKEHKKIVPGFNKHGTRNPFIKSARKKFASIYGVDSENDIALARIKFQNIFEQKLMLDKCKAILWLETCSLDDIKRIGEYVLHKDNATIDHIRGIIHISSDDIINIFAYRMTS